MSLPRRVDVLVVGLGPVGATIANLLGRYGVNTLVVDQAREIFTAPRAIALDNEALRILQLAGVGDVDFARCEIAKVRMHSPMVGDFAQANTAGKIDGHPKLVTFYQPELEQALRNKLANYPCVRVETGVAVTAISAETEAVQIDLQLADGSPARVTAGYLIGSDGANSFVRRMLGLEFEGQTYAKDWLIVDAKGVAEPIDHIEFNCDPARPGPHMLAPGGRQRWEFMLQPGETREQMEQPEMVRQLLRPWIKNGEFEIERVAVYRFHARVADRFSRGRLFLAGDAAHITPPFAGQGLVAGLRDAANLCWKLAAVVHGQAAPAILASYDSERRPHAQAIIKLARVMGQLIMPSNRLLALLLHGTLRVLGLLPPVRAWIGELKLKPPPVFKQGLFRHPTGGAPLLCGGLFPQGLVTPAQGGALLSDELLGAGLTLVGFGVDPQSLLPTALRDAWSQIDGRFLQIDRRGQGILPGSHTPHCEDIADCFRMLAGRVAIVRPDRVVMCEGPAAETTQLLDVALALLGRPSRLPAPAAATHAAGIAS